MRFGVCIPFDMPERILPAKKAGFDYIESGFSALAKADESQFEAFKEALDSSSIVCEALNGMVPYYMPIVGKEYNKAEVAKLIENGMKRSAQLGVKIAVLGSGKARNYPDYMTYKEAFSALTEVVSNVIAPVAEHYGITVVIEPLRKFESKIINTLREGVMLASASNNKSVSGLADLFHMACEGDTNDEIIKLKGDIKHAHFSNPYYVLDGMPSRCYPKSNEEFDYKGFIDALEFVECPRCSIEAKTEDYENDVIASGKLIQTLR